jgi:hypothetical protein
MLIIDSRSCTNAVSTDVVEKLGLDTIKHPQPYKLQWLKDRESIKVVSQAYVPFSLTKYEDRILCDIIPMTVTHIFWDDLGNLIKG